MNRQHPVKAQQADPMMTGGSAKARGAVVVYACKPHRNPHGHECMTQSELARRLAALRGDDFAGEYDPSCRYDGPVYFVPSDTLVLLEAAQSLGIYGEQDLFGGVVPFPFVATKTITHGLPDAQSHAPGGWSTAFAQRVQDAVLPGYSAFTLSDARNAALRLLKGGAVRLKKAGGIGGLGQVVITDADELEAQLEALDIDELLQKGVVLERNLKNVATHSVGQARVGNLLATYCGIQRLTVSNHGEQVYGGSNLTVVRGDFDALLRLPLADAVRTAIGQARVYHAAAIASYAGMYASRANYDVAQGVDDEGQWYSGVLEQSWRIGGASAAELAALEAFRADPALNVVSASTTEIYGEYPTVPTDAQLVFQGDDEQIGRITKYSRIEPHVNA